MTLSMVQLVLAAWGALLSTFLAVVKVIEFKYAQSAMLDVDADGGPDRDALTVTDHQPRQDESTGSIDRDPVRQLGL
jgi:hypothetical protein